MHTSIFTASSPFRESLFKIINESISQIPSGASLAQEIICYSTRGRDLAFMSLCRTQDLLYLRDLHPAGYLLGRGRGVYMKVRIQRPCISFVSDNIAGISFLQATAEGRTMSITILNKQVGPIGFGLMGIC